jgi:hypothetical protein
VDCDRRKRDFVIEEGTLRPARPGFLIATCSLPVSSSGRVTGFRARAREGVNGSQIWVSLQWLGPDGKRREVAYCQINGNTRKPATGCDAKLVEGRTAFGPGGQLVAEMHFDLKTRPKPVRDYSVQDLEATYVVTTPEEEASR